MEILPVASSIQVLEYRTYIRTTNRWVVLAAVRSEYGTTLKFYKWRRKEECWKVDLARFQVRDVDLCRIAADAIELAQKHRIKLKWPSLQEIAKAQSPPECPRCNSRTNVREHRTMSFWHCRACGESWST